MYLTYLAVRSFLAGLGSGPGSGPGPEGHKWCEQRMAANFHVTHCFFCEGGLWSNTKSERKKMRKREEGRMKVKPMPIKREQQYKRLWHPRQAIVKNFRIQKKNKVILGSGSFCSRFYNGSMRRKTFVFVWVDFLFQSAFGWVKLFPFVEKFMPKGVKSIARENVFHHQDWY